MITYGRYLSQTNDDGQFNIEKYFLFGVSLMFSDFLVMH